MLNHILPGLKIQEIKILFNRIDDDQNGFISFSEFFMTFSNNFVGKVSHINESIDKKSQSSGNGGEHANFDISLGL
jgi:Ca2+-binding EF-hand superfamily protein